MTRNSSKQVEQNPSASQGTAVPLDDFPQIGIQTKRGRNGHKNGQVELLMPGWAGSLDDDELIYILNEVRRLPSLAKKWGFKTTQRITPESVRRVALYGDADNLAQNRQVARPWFSRRRD